MLDKVTIHSTGSTVAECQESVQALFEAVRLASGAPASAELIDEHYQLDADNADPFNARRYVGRGTLHFAGMNLEAADVLETMQQLLRGPTVGATGTADA